jgi:hypothetical protein
MLNFIEVYLLIIQKNKYFNFHYFLFLWYFIRFHYFILYFKFIIDNFEFEWIDFFEIHHYQLFFSYLSS